MGLESKLESSRPRQPRRRSRLSPRGMLSRWPPRRVAAGSAAVSGLQLMQLCAECGPPTHTAHAATRESAPLHLRRTTLAAALPTRRRGSSVSGGADVMVVVLVHLHRHRHAVPGYAWVELANAVTWRVWYLVLCIAFGPHWQRTSATYCAVSSRTWYPPAQ